MSLYVPPDKIKERLGIETDDFDEAIDNLVIDMVPALEYAIAPHYLADTGNANLQATLFLCAIEIFCGEVAAMMLRWPGAAETVVVGDVEVSALSPALYGMLDLREQGWARLRPFMKRDVALPSAEIGASGGKQPEGE